MAEIDDAKAFLGTGWAFPPQPAAGDDMAVVESAKTASDVYAPISGEVVEADSEISSENWPIINEAPQAGGWFVKLKVADKSELDGLMDEAAYADYVKGL